VLQFHREPVRAPHLVLVGSRQGRDVESDRLRHRVWRTPVLLVLAATLLAVAVDLVDSVPAWSHWAAFGSALVLFAHAGFSRLRSR
jgi:hypothetical protein